MTVKLGQSYYASLCWYVLDRLGFLGGDTAPSWNEKAQELSDMGEDFSFAAPLAGGPIFTFVYQIPGYISPKSPEQLDKLARALCQLIAAKSIEPVVSKWPEATAYWRQWFTPGWKRMLFAPLEEDPEQAQQLVQQFMALAACVWPEYEEQYAASLQDYPFSEFEERCGKLQVFEQWREELGVAYPYDSFELVICPQSNTSASSLGPEKVVFGAKHPWPTLKNAVVHEVGVRMMNLDRLAEAPATAELMLNDYGGLLQLVEAEVCYRKPRLLPELTQFEEDPFVTGMNLEELVKWRATRQPRGTIPEWLASSYQDAKAKGLL